MRSSWDPATLSFSNPVLESHYTTHLVISTFLNVDRTFAHFGIVMNIVVSFFVMVRKKPAVFFIFHAINAMSALFVITALKKWRLWYLRNRTPVIWIIRSYHIAQTVHAYCKMSPEVPEVYQLYRVIAFGAACIFWTVGMPLKFKARHLNKRVQPL